MNVPCSGTPSQSVGSASMVIAPLCLGNRHAAPGPDAQRPDLDPVVQERPGSLLPSGVLQDDLQPRRRIALRPGRARAEAQFALFPRLQHQRLGLHASRRASDSRRARAQGPGASSPAIGSASSTSTASPSTSMCRFFLATSSNSRSHTSASQATFSSSRSATLARDLVLVDRLAVLGEGAPFTSLLVEVEDGDVVQRRPRCRSRRNRAPGRAPRHRRRW